MLHSLTGLRFLAALSIVFAHLCSPLQYNIFGISLPGSMTSLLGMPLFFVLSGFVIHYNYGALFCDTPWHQATRHFFVARFARIYPLFIVALVFHLWHDDMFMHLWQKDSNLLLLAASFVFNIFSWYPIWLDGKLLIQHNFGIAWSISTEWFFYASYIFFGGYLFTSSVKTTIKLLAAVVLIAFSTQFLGSENPKIVQNLFLTGPPGSEEWINSFYRWFFYVSPYSRIFEFFLGCCIAQLILRRDIKLWPNSKTINFLIVTTTGLVFLTLALYIVAFSMYKDWLHPPTPLLMRFFLHMHLNFGFAILFAGLILLLAVRDLRGESTGKMLVSRSFLLLGNASYSLYLTHVIALRIVPIAQDMPHLWFRLLSGLIITLIFAVGSYMIIEVPMRRWIRSALAYKKPQQ